MANTTNTANTTNATAQQQPNRTQSVRKCQVCEEPTKDMNHFLCEECRRDILLLRRTVTLMEKDGLCFVTGFGEVGKEVKSINV